MNWSSINGLDLLIAVIMISSIIAAIVAGFARSGIGMACAIVGVVLGLWFYGIPAGWIHSWFPSGVPTSGMIANVFGFLLIFFAIVIAGGYVGRAVMKLFESSGLGWMDHAAGGIFGFLRGTLATAALVTILLAFMSKPIPDWMVNSKALPYAISAADMVAALAPPKLRETVQTNVRETREAWVKRLEQGRSELEALEAPVLIKPSLEKFRDKPSDKKAEPKNRGVKNQDRTLRERDNVQPNVQARQGQ